MKYFEPIELQKTKHGGLNSKDVATLSRDKLVGKLIAKSADVPAQKHLGI